MSTLTPNLGLFKYNPETDGKETFSITTALNNNWDILDNVMSSTSSLGESGYMKFNNGLTINYGQASISSQEVPWQQPILTSDGVIGGDSFAVRAQIVNSQYAYHGFDKNNSTYTYYSANNGTDTGLVMYFPIPVKMTSITLTAAQNTAPTGNILPGTDAVTWLSPIGTWSGMATNSSVVIPLDNNDFYQYYKISPTTWDYIWTTLKEVSITATYITQALNSITFPCAFTTTNYAYSLAYRNGRFGDSYAKTLTNTGMTLQNNSNADAVYYIAVGY